MSVSLEVLPEIKHVLKVLEGVSYTLSDSGCFLQQNKKKTKTEGKKLQIKERVKSVTL